MNVLIRRFAPLATALSVVVLTPQPGSTQSVPTPTRDAPPGKTLADGHYRTDGYGLLLGVQGDSITLHQTANGVALPLAAGARVENSTGRRFRIESPLGNFELDLIPIAAPRQTSAGDAAVVGTMQVAGTVSSMRLLACSERPPEFDSTPQRNAKACFEMFDSAFRTHYPFFAEREVDWNEAMSRLGKTLTESSTDDELFSAMRAAIAPLADSHIFIDRGSQSASFQRFAAQPSSSQAVRALFAFVDQNTLTAEPESACSGHVKFGRIDRQVESETSSYGYLRVDAFSNFVKAGTDQHARSEVALARSLDAALAAFGKDCSGVVIDLRQNWGGSDALAVQLAARFTDRSYLGFTKQARNDPTDAAAMTPATEVVVEPHDGTRYSGPIAILTSRYTISAGEVFLLAMMGRTPAVMRIGEATQGVFSDVLPRALPNGWTFGLPNERYVGPDSENYVARGVPPTTELPLPPADAAKPEADPALEEALSELQTAGRQQRRDR